MPKICKKDTKNLQKNTRITTKKYRKSAKKNQKYFRVSGTLEPNLKPWSSPNLKHQGFRNPGAKPQTLEEPKPQTSGFPEPLNKH